MVAKMSVAWFIVLIASRMDQIHTLTAEEGYAMSMKTLEERLRDPQQYDTAIIPPVEGGGPLVVDVMLIPWQILDLNEKDQTCTSVIWADFSWVDPRLKWNQTFETNSPMLHLRGDQVWKPDLFLQNGNGEKPFFSSLDDTSLLGLWPSGLVGWYPIQRVETTCEMDVATYPFDTQECYYQIGSWMYSSEQLILRFRNNATKIRIPYLIGNSEWELVDTRLSQGNVQFVALGYPMTQFHIKLRRKVSFFTFALIMPCILLTFLTMMVFFIPPQSGEKISLGVSVWTSLMVFLLILVEVVPANSNVLPLLGVYNTFTLILVTMSLVFSIFTIRLYYHHDHKPVPPWVHLVVFKILARLMCMSKCSCCGMQNEPKDHYKEALKDHRVRIFSISNNSRRKLTNLSNGYAADVHENHASVNDAYKEFTDLRNGYQETATSVNAAGTSPEAKTLAAIRQTLEKMADRKDKADLEKKHIAAWEDVAEVIDRFLFWVFLTITFVFTVVVSDYYFSS